MFLRVLDDDTKLSLIPQFCQIFVPARRTGKAMKQRRVAKHVDRDCKEMENVKFIHTACRPKSIKKPTCQFEFKINLKIFSYFHVLRLWRAFSSSRLRIFLPAALCKFLLSTAWQHSAQLNVYYSLSSKCWIGMDWAASLCTIFPLLWVHCTSRIQMLVLIDLVFSFVLRDCFFFP